MNHPHILVEKFFIPHRDETTQKVAEIEGVKLYSSNKLRADYVSAIKMSKYGKYIGDTINNLVLQNRIIPCFLNKGIISLTLYKIFSKDITKRIAGYYDNINKQIFVLIDSNTNIFSYASNDSLATLTIHESVHMLAYNKPAIFYRLFKDDLIKFYDFYFENVFEIQNKYIRNTDDLIVSLINLTKKSHLDKRDLIYYINVIESIYKKESSLSINEFNNKLNLLSSCIVLILTDPISFIRQANVYSNIIGTPLKKAYKETFGKIPKDVLLFQELISASEVISVASEMKMNQKVVKGIQSI